MRVTKVGAGAVVALIASLALAACSSSGTTSGSAGGANTSGSSGGAKKTLVLAVPYACNFQYFIQQACAAATSEAKALGYNLEIKTGTNYQDTTAFNSLLQTVAETHPAGIIVDAVYPDGSTSTLKQICAQGIKIVAMDGQITGLGNCLSGWSTAANTAQGANLATWLTQHPPKTKDVMVVSFPPGQVVAFDQRVQGFTQAATAAGYHVIPATVTGLTGDAARSAITNTLTAHPDISAVFLVTENMASATHQALAGRSLPVLTADFFPANGTMISSGVVTAGSAQDPMAEGQGAVELMSKVLDGQSVPAVIYAPTKVIYTTDLAAYESAGGLH
jgi:ABC-type sugar transport system substrate-binding protein